MSYDIDACDPTVAPATGTTVPGGLNFREALFVAEEVAYTRRLVSMDMVELNPDLGDDAATEKTVDMAIRVVKASLGDVILPDPFENMSLK